MDDDRIKELREYVMEFANAPLLEEMPRNSLEDKGIAGPTAAHRIEEIHTPLNYEYVTLTTGSTAFQNIVGVTAAEIPGRVRASHRALELCGVKKGDHLLFTYPPLVNVFTRQALADYGASWSFLARSSREAMILALVEKRPRVVVGESTFLKASLKDAVKMGLSDCIPRGLILITAGTPMDLELPETAERLAGATVHDLYGAQEFGWITLDGRELREDIVLEEDGHGRYDLIVGGLSVGDSFLVNEKGHLSDRRGKILTYARKRVRSEYETTILSSTVSDSSTLERLARGILRIKARIVRVSPDVALRSDRTVLLLAHYGEENGKIIEGPEKTKYFDSLLKAQLDYQQLKKNDPAWSKNR